MFYLAGIFCLFVTLVLIIYSIVIFKQQKKIDRQAAKIKRLQIDLSDESHAQHWNMLWTFIRNKFNVFKREDGTWNGGKAVKQIFIAMREEFGTFTKKQMSFIEELVMLLREVVDEQREWELNQTPINKDIEFDGQGGFRVINTEPSKN